MSISLVANLADGGPGGPENDPGQFHAQLVRELAALAQQFPGDRMGRASFVLDKYPHALVCGEARIELNLAAPGGGLAAGVSVMAGLVPCAASGSALGEFAPKLGVMREELGQQRRRRCPSERRVRVSMRSAFCAFGWGANTLATMVGEPFSPILVRSSIPAAALSQIFSGWRAARNMSSMVAKRISLIPSSTVTRQGREVFST